jgi:hypothetical protein
MSKPDVRHVCEPDHTPASGTGYQVCRCGATRRLDNGRPFGGWHACALCVAGYGQADNLTKEN